MKVRPKTLNFFSIFLIGVALSFPIQIMILYGHSPLEFGAIFAKLTVLNWGVIAFAALNAWLVLRAESISRVTLPLAVVLVAVNNWIVGKYEMDFSPLVATLATVGFVACHGPLYRSQIRELFNNPAKRWWLIAPRKQIEILAHVCPLNGAAFKTTTFDISENGAFIRLGTHITEGDRRLGYKKLSVNDRVRLCLTVGISQIRCDARVVREAGNSKGNYPMGLGIRFEDLSRQHRNEIRRLISNPMTTSTPATI